MCNDFAGLSGINLVCCLFEVLMDFFNSAPHALLAMGKVEPLHPELAIDPLNILRPHSKLIHQLPLVKINFQSLFKFMYCLIFPDYMVLVVV